MMSSRMCRRAVCFAVCCLAWSVIPAYRVRAESKKPVDPLPSWNEGTIKSALLDIVKRTTTKGGAEYVAPRERIAVFDNDGTLWCEQPVYFQLQFALDRIKAQADKHPEWKDKEPFKSVLSGDMQGLAALGEKGLLEVVMTSHSGMSTTEFNATVKEWIKTARHPKYHRPYNRCIYQPMVEVLRYFRANGYKTFIVSGGGIEFMRAWTEEAYGIPPEQVVGSSGVVKYELRDGKPVLFKEPKVEFVDDGPGKPVGINHFIGRRPIIAFGNSDGDFQMLQYTTAGDPKRLGLIVHHTDDVREVAYGRHSKIGKLDKALDEAPKAGWLLIDMKQDWKVIFPEK